MLKVVGYDTNKHMALVMNTNNGVVEEHTSSELYRLRCDHGLSFTPLQIKDTGKVVSKVNRSNKDIEYRVYQYRGMDNKLYTCELRDVQIPNLVRQGVIVVV